MVLETSGGSAAPASRLANEGEGTNGSKVTKTGPSPLVRKCGRDARISMGIRWTAGQAGCFRPRRAQGSGLRRGVGARPWRQVVLKIAEDIGVNVGRSSLALENTVGAAGVDAHVERLAERYEFIHQQLKALE